MEHSEATKNKITLLAALAGFMLTLVVAIVGYEFNRIVNTVDGIAVELDETHIIALTNQTYIRNHGEVGDAKRHIARIDNLESRIFEIRTDSTKRKDPYTGTQAEEADTIYRAIMAALHRRLYRLEQSLIDGKVLSSKEAAITKDHARRLDEEIHSTIRFRRNALPMSGMSGISGMSGMSRMGGMNPYRTPEGMTGMSGPLPLHD